MPSFPQLSGQKEFLVRHNFTDEQFSATGLDWGQLAQIHSRHSAAQQELQTAANGVVESLRHAPDIHSIKVRVKHPDSLVAKIIRKKVEEPKFKFDPSNYSRQITDLIGIRALHLFKDQWQPINDFVRENWRFVEKPKAYIRAGDAEPLRRQFSDRKCAIEEHKFGYRSVHYLLKTQPTRKTFVAELQVRTLFEEAWSEIDHLLRYPNVTSASELTEFLRIFNRLAGSADEMGTFIKNLSKSRDEYLRALAEAKTKLDDKESELRETIKQLNLSEQDRRKLEKQIAAAHPNPILGGITVRPTNLFAGSGLGYIGVSEKRKCPKCGKDLPLWSLSCPECPTYAFGSLAGT